MTIVVNVMTIVNLMAIVVNLITIVVHLMTIVVNFMTIVVFVNYCLASNTLTSPLMCINNTNTAFSYCL